MFVILNRNLSNIIYLKMAPTSIVTEDNSGWWPDVASLLSEKIEITGGVQRPGDLVVIPTNIVHFGFALVSIIYL